MIFRWIHRTSDLLCLEVCRTSLFTCLINASSLAGACDEVFSRLKVLVATQILCVVALDMFVHSSWCNSTQENGYMFLWGKMETFTKYILAIIFQCHYSGEASPYLGSLLMSRSKNQLRHRYWERNCSLILDNFLSDL